MLLLAVCLLGIWLCAYPGSKRSGPGLAVLAIAAGIFILLDR